MLILQPTTSAPVKPNRRSAAALKEWMCPPGVDNDQGIGHGVEDRMEQGLAAFEFPLGLLRVAARVLGRGRSAGRVGWRW